MEKSRLQINPKSSLTCGEHVCRAWRELHLSFYERSLHTASVRVCVCVCVCVCGVSIEKLKHKLLIPPPFGLLYGDEYNSQFKAGAGVLTGYFPPPQIMESIQVMQIGRLLDSRSFK